MKQWTYLLAGLFILLLTDIGCRTKKTTVLSPRLQYPGLFEAVQQSEVFPDSKTFPDCIPRYPGKKIQYDYSQLNDRNPASLDTFVRDYFSLPEQAAASYQSDTNDAVKQHIQGLWQVLKRSDNVNSKGGSLIPLPHPYVVPGGRFREVYYWDSYFTMLGLKQSGRMELIQNMLDNFAWLVEQFGFIPNGNRSYYLTRSQPPFFSLMVDLSAVDSTDLIPYKKYATALIREYEYWMQSGRENTPGHMVVINDSIVLNRYYDQGDYPREESWKEDIATAANSRRTPGLVYRELRSGAESGWDFSSRWLDSSNSLSSIHTTDILPLDLNCLLYHLERTLVKVYTVLDNKSKAKLMERAAVRRKIAIQQLMWNEDDGWYHDYNWRKASQTTSVNAAAMFPLYFNIARQSQADSSLQILKAKLLQDGGIATTNVITGQQWDAPNGWAPLQWITVQGLRRYGHDSLAQVIADRWLQLNLRVYKRTGKLLEKYNVADTTLTGGGGEYPNQDGFGWTNGVLLMLLEED